jgi:hypothetical protein
LARVNVVGTTKEDIKVPIPCKLVGLHEALEKNFDWICPENPFDKSSEPKSVHKGSSKTHLDTIQFFLKILLQLILMPHLIILDLHFLRLAQGVKEKHSWEITQCFFFSNFSFI